MIPHRSSFLITCAIALMPLTAAAERADRDQPIQVEADRMEYDDARKVNTFSGRVQLTQGTIRIRADRLVVRQDAEGNSFGLAEGRPARFRQKRDGVDEFIEGEGQTIDYNGKSEVVTLTGQASLRRLQGAKLTDEVHGTRIVYQGRSEFYTVESGPVGERVRVVIQPKRSGDPPAPATAPLKPAPALARPPAR
ncbi:MAG: hypothetical protein RL322_462 [Pseudomonadota bacterium]|jgi:lipopolysaccharide export system protein LptA